MSLYHYSELLRGHDHRVGDSHRLARIRLRHDQRRHPRQTPSGHIGGAALAEVARRVRVGGALHRVEHPDAIGDIFGVARRPPHTVDAIQRTEVLRHHMISVKAPPAEHLPTQRAQIMRVQAQLPRIRAQVAALGLEPRDLINGQPSLEGARDIETRDMTRLPADRLARCCRRRGARVVAGSSPLQRTAASPLSHRSAPY